MGDSLGKGALLSINNFEYKYRDFLIQYKNALYCPLTCEYVFTFHMISTFRNVTPV